ncbi:MAG: hypothetical protein OXC07_12285 [Kistimonas sp.]|nr:hypothetical protein [Kistimonas sp.]
MNDGDPACCAALTASAMRSRMQHCTGARLPEGMALASDASGSVNLLCWWVCSPSQAQGIMAACVRAFI